MQVGSELSTQEIDDTTNAMMIFSLDNTTHDDSGDLQIDDTNVATSTLMNPLLLNLIFSYMDAPTLKTSVRPVCTLWADLGAPFLGRKTTQLFSERIKCDTEVPETIGLATFHPKLAKNVKLVSCTCPCDSPEVLPRNFVAARPEIARHLEELEVKIDSSFLPGLHKMWRSKAHLFENLSKISITAVLYTDENADSILTGSYPTIENVKMISIRMADQDRDGQDKLAAAISQQLVYSTPNLQEVEVEAGFYLDFSPCKKLVKFKYTFIKFLDWETEERSEVVEIDKVVKMLESCRESLTELSLSQVLLEDFEDDEDDDEMPTLLLLPSFPNLTRLSISSMEVYRLGDCLCATNLPNLTHVSLAGSVKQWFALTDMFSHLRHPHVGVTSLHLDAAYDGDDDHANIGTEIVHLFPSVKTLQLKVTLLEYLHMDDLEEISLLKQTLRNFAP
ncbi:uncharacterized protein LOC118437937 [Folsomia candida]|uniref:F-box domain-containing protein n=1 Tax=Folsomia candida TaxID=158441 RepID=A0A226DKC9_FOLCA|nr:uncharacterized protein LOC118437937 [Folsomia candida]OXA45448.1 hypothetical protein Fcan01_19440 [Folsomia candida]